MEEKFNKLLHNCVVAHGFNKGDKIIKRELFKLRDFVNKNKEFSTNFANKLFN